MFPRRDFAKNFSKVYLYTYKHVQQISKKSILGVFSRTLNNPKFEPFWGKIDKNSEIDQL